MKKSPISLLLLLAVFVAGGYVVYYYAVKPWLDKRAINKAVEKGCEEMVKRFDEQKEEIAEDLAALLEKIDSIDEQDDMVRKDIENILQELEEK